MMANNKGRQFGRKAGLIALIVLTIVCYGAAMAVYGNTLTGPWTPALAAVALAAAASLWLAAPMGRLTALKARWLNFAISVAMLTGAFLAAIYIVNYTFADDSTLHTERADIARLYYKTRHRTKRVGRRTVTTGETYKVYFAELHFNSGKVKDISLSLQQYNRMRRLDSIDLPVERGALGMPVIKRNLAEI